MSATVKETAAAMRQELRKTYPGTKFTVRMDTGTAHGWIGVSWEDGPTESTVRERLAQFESRQFDPSTDAYHRTGNDTWNCCGVATSRLYSTTYRSFVEAMVQYEPGSTMPFITDGQHLYYPRYGDDDPQEVARLYMADHAAA